MNKNSTDARLARDVHHAVKELNRAVDAARDAGLFVSIAEAVRILPGPGEITMPVFIATVRRIIGL